MKKLLLIMVLVSSGGLLAMEPAPKRQKIESASLVPSLKKLSLAKLVGVRGDNSKNGALDGYLDACFNGSDFNEKGFEELLALLKKNLGVIDLEVAEEFISAIRGYYNSDEYEVFVPHFRVELTNIFGRHLAAQIYDRWFDKLIENCRFNTIFGQLEVFKNHYDHCAQVLSIDQTKLMLRIELQSLCECSLLHGTLTTIQQEAIKTQRNYPKTSDGKTILHIAVLLQSNARTIKGLLNLGCNPLDKDAKGNTAYDYAANKNCGLFSNETSPYIISIDINSFNKDLNERITLLADAEKEWRAKEDSKK